MHSDHKMHKLIECKVAVTYKQAERLLKNGFDVIEDDGYWMTKDGEKTRRLW